MKNMKKIFVPFILIFLLFSIIFTAGCVETGRTTQSENYIVGKISVTEVTYLWGDDGPFTKQYVVSIQALGSTRQSTTMSKAEYESIKNGIVGYFLPDFGNSVSSSQQLPQVIQTTSSPIYRSTLTSTPIKTYRPTLSPVSTPIYRSTPISTLIPTYTPKTQQPTYTQVTQMPANIQMIGNVYGIALNPSSGIDEIRFTIGLAPGAPAIDLTKMKIVFSTLSTSPIVLTHGAIASTSFFTTKLDGNNVNTMYIFNQDEITFKISPVKANTKIFIELRPAVGASLPFSKTIPTTISKMNILY